MVFGRLGCFGMTIVWFYCAILIYLLTYLLTYLGIYLLTYLLTPWSRVLLEKLTSSQLVKKFPALYGTRRFITAFTSARHLSLSWARSIQSVPSHPISWRSILILSSHLRPSLPIGLSPSCFPTKTLYTPYLSPKRSACPAHLILLDLITQIILGEVYCSITLLNTFTAIVDLSRFKNSCLKSPASTLVDLTFQSRALRSFSLNQLRNLSL